MKRIIYSSLFSLILFSSCNQPIDSDHDHARESESEASNDKEMVHLLQRQIDVMGIELGGFSYLNLSTTIKSNGQLELPPQNKASLSAVISGRVKEVLVIEGDFVQKGQVLAYLEDPQIIEWQEEYYVVKSELEYLELDFARKEELYADSITSAKSYQQSRAAFHSAKAKLSALRAKLSMLNLDLDKVEHGEFVDAFPVVAPIEGYVYHTAVNIGMFIDLNEEMFEIVDNEHIHIDLMVYEKDLNKVHDGQKVIFSLASNPDSIFEGSVFAVGKSFEQDIKAVVVHAEINNPTGNLLPGMYVDARIVIDSAKVRAVPNSAIIRDGGLDYIFVLSNEEEIHEHDQTGDQHTHSEDDDHAGEYIFQKIEVNSGASDIGFTEVIPAYDIPEDVQFVTNGSFYLLAELKKGEGGHGHHH